MSKIVVDANTLIELSKSVKDNNEKLLNIVNNIKNTTIKYNNMLISDAGELFKDIMIKEQEKEQEKIILNNQIIADKLSSFGIIYSDTDKKIGDLMR